MILQVVAYLNQGPTWLGILKAINETEGPVILRRKFSYLLFNNSYIGLGCGFRKTRIPGLLSNHQNN